MAILSKEDFDSLYTQLRDLPDEAVLVLTSLLDHEAVSDAELAARLALLPSKVATSVHALADRGLVNVEVPGEEQRLERRIHLNPWGVEAAKLWRSLERMERVRTVS